MTEPLIHNTCPYCGKPPIGISCCPYDDLVTRVRRIEKFLALDYSPPPATDYRKVHECCGCSCDRCARGHNTGSRKIHTVACEDRLMKEATDKGQLE